MKKLLIGLGSLLALGAILLGLLLIPAHMQIRDVAPELPSKADLENLKGNAAGPIKISYFETSRQSSTDFELGHSTFVIEWDDGRILLIDLGMDREVAVEFGELFETIGGAEPAVPVGTVPELLGDDLGRVRGIGFTHLHSDHVQGIEPICGSTDQMITVLQSADQMAKHNLHTEDQAELLGNADCVEQVQLPGDARLSELFPGIGIYPLGGHTPGSTMFAIAVDGKLWLLTGDISNAQSDLLEDREKGFFYSYLMVPENVDRLAMLRPWLADLDADPDITAIVSHDSKALADSGMDQWQRPDRIE